MPIGVSYTRNGMTSSFRAGDVNDIYQKLKAQRAAERQAKREARTDGERHKGNGVTFPIDVRKLIGFGSSIEEKSGKLQLMGDDKICQPGFAYGKNKSGIKGFWSINDLLEVADPRNVGKTIGNADSTDDANDTEKRSVSDKSPFTITTVFRVFIENREKLIDATVENHMIIVAGLRDISFTAAGRAFAVSEERLLDIGEIPTRRIEVSCGGTNLSATKVVLEPESNVKINLEDLGLGTVGIKIGVRYA